MKELDTFYANFMNRDQPILEDSHPNLDDYLKKIIPDENQQEDNKINEETEKAIKNKAKEDFKIEIEDFKNKDKNELIDKIKSTFKNLNEKFKNGEESQYYYETIQLNSFSVCSIIILALLLLLDRFNFPLLS